jgi:hypothetical protein
MENNEFQIEYVVGSAEIIEKMKNNAVQKIFGDISVKFLNNLSEKILHDKAAKAYSDVITFAFWCRRASLIKMAEKYCQGECRLGKGILFHIAPSNVAVNFAYSLAAGLLAGNSNIVRLPSKHFVQADIICRNIAELLLADAAMRPFICLVKYSHDKKITDWLSKICHMRIIWGGDNTIAEIRKSPLEPYAGEITFFDRFSVMLIDGQKYITMENKADIAERFYNDTYLTDQNACTAPRIIVWLNATADIKKIFWDNVGLKLDKYSFQPVQAVDKLEMMCRAAILEKASLSYKFKNLLVCMEIKSLDKAIRECMGNSGFFLEYAAASLDELMELFSNRKCQTVACVGIDKAKVKAWLECKRPLGVDRVTDVGATMDFSLNWDGHNLISEMSRVIE